MCVCARVCRCNLGGGCLFWVLLWYRTSSASSYIPSHRYFYFWQQSWSTAWTGLALLMLLPQPPRMLASQVCTTVPSTLLFFFFSFPFFHCFLKSQRHHLTWKPLCIACFSAQTFNQHFSEWLRAPSFFGERRSERGSSRWAPRAKGFTVYSSTLVSTYACVFRFLNWVKLILVL